MSFPPMPEDTLPEGPPDYYSAPTQKVDLKSRFSDLDDPESYTRCEEKIEDPGTYSFVADVWSTKAWCAVDLDAAAIKSILTAERPSSLELRWINIWGGDLRKETVDVIATHYDLAPRLKGLMCSEAVSSPMKPTASTANYSGQTTDLNKLSIQATHDVEKAGQMSMSDGTAEHRQEDIDLRKITNGQIANEIWHWSSVDWGERYLCLSYNSLFTIKGVDYENGPNKPGGKRIWSSLILCDDGTVISIYEDPFPNSIPDRKVLKTVRRNVLNVFRHLSKIHMTDKHIADTLMKVQIRSFDQATAALNSAPPMKPASLLMYYLFDDWITTYGLVAKLEHPYSLKLDQLRSEMSQKANVDLVESLHRVGRRLGVLKRVYQSYEQMINRILQRQRAIRDEARRGIRPVQMPDEVDGREHSSSNQLHSSVPMLSSSEDMSLGVRLDSAAIVRFERLLDRIRLYALNEIEECLAEKEALNFNLIALKEAQAVEKLTRTTILLAKATMLFLPVSLMTGYFSTQIQDLQNVYTAKTYWVTFLVIVVLTVFLLLFFGLISDSVEGKTVYKSLWRTSVDFSRTALGRRRKKKEC